MSITHGPVEYKLLLHDFYEEYKLTQSYELVMNNFIDRLQNEIVDDHSEVDYERVYPYLRKQSKENEFVSEPFGPDLEIYFVNDFGDYFGFIQNKDNLDFQKLKQIAYENLDKTPFKWVQIDNSYSIWTFEELTELSSSLFILPKVRKRIEKHLGKEFYVAFSSPTTILVGACTSLNYDLINKLITYDPDNNKISDEIYLYSDGNLSFTSPRNRFEVIKGGLD